MTELTLDHPLHQTLTKASQLSEYIKAGLGNGSEAEWLTPDALLAPQSPHLAVLIRTTQRRLRTEAANMIGGSLIQEYQWPLIATAIACFLIDRRVPDLRPENIQLRLPVEEQEGEEDHRERITYRTGRFAALPDDPAANHPDATIVADLDALREQLRIGIETHMGWVIGQLHAQTRANARGLWLFVADRCAGTLSWLMQEQDKSVSLCCIEPEVDALIRVSGSPLQNKKVGFFELTYKDKTHVYLDRATCCYWYKTEGGDYCTTCPHRAKDDRNERLLKYMAEEYEKAV
jgi:hypothetical protein